MHRPKMVATDLDGTFFDDNKKFDQIRFADLLERMQKHDMRFVVATGRDEASVMHFFAPFKDQIDFVLNNGALVVNAKGETLHQTSLTASDLKHAVDIVNQMPFKPRIAPHMIGRKHMYAFRRQNDLNVAFWQRLRLRGMDPKVVLIDRIDDIEEDILKFMINYREEDTMAFIHTAHAVLGETGHVTTSGYGAVDIVAAGVDKAQGLRFLGDHYGIPLEEELAAFGDGMNDIEMLHAAGFSFVMPNADPELFEYHFGRAHASNNRQGVLKTIEDLWLD